MLIGGEAGIGKSRLVAQCLRNVAGGRANRIVSVECVQEGGTELWPIRSALADVLKYKGDDAPPIVLRTLAQLLPHHAETRGFAGAMLPKAELFAGLVAVLTHVSAKRGVILVLEDIHWADRSTLEFLGNLAAHIDAMRLLIIATYRSERFEVDDALADVIARLMRAHGVRHFPLRPLQPPEVAELIEGTLQGHAAIPATTVSNIIERCEGNPFFAEELVKTALEEGPLQSEALPFSIRLSIRHRLANFSPDHLGVLEVAAVLGMRFEHRLLAQLTGREIPAVLRLLREARAANIVDDVDGSSCRFHHALIRQTLYDGLLAGETQALHRRILSALEASPDLESRIDALAYHAWQSGHRAASGRYSERAGDDAMSRGAFADARAYYERMLSAIDDDGDRARLFERYGTAATAQGDFAAAIVALEAAQALRLARDELDDATRIAVAIAVERTNAGADSVTELERFLELHGARLSRSAGDAARVFLARIMTATERFDDAEALLRDTSPLAQLAPRVRANALTCRLNVSEHRGAVEAWSEAAHEMLVLAPELPPLMRSIQLTNVAQTGGWLGERAVTRVALAEAQALAQHWGFEGILTFSRAIEAQLAYLDGELVLARAALDAVARMPDVAPAQMAAARVGPFIAAAFGDPALARRCVASDAVRAAACDDGDSEALHIVAATLAGGGPIPHWASHTRLAQLLRTHARGAFLPPTVAVTAARHLVLADFKDLLDATDAGATATGNAVALATRDLVRAITATRSGRPDRDIALEAAEGFRDLQWPLFHALALEHAGRPAEARSIYISCGAVADVRRLDTRERAPAPPPSLLTARETQIARLIAGGATNAVIADRLDVGTKAIEKHVSNILSKLEARSRTQIATYITARERPDAEE